MLLVALAAATAQPLPDDVRKMEIAWQVANALDFATTEYCLRNRSGCEEANPLIGKRPSTAKLLAFKAGSGVLHYIAARELVKVDHNAAKIFEIGSLIVTGGTVAANLRFVF